MERAAQDVILAFQPLSEPDARENAIAEIEASVVG
jgi:hypothetical protein